MYNSVRIANRENSIEHHKRLSSTSSVVVFGTRKTIPKLTTDSHLGIEAICHCGGAHFDK